MLLRVCLMVMVFIPNALKAQSIQLEPIRSAVSDISKNTDSINTHLESLDRSMKSLDLDQIRMDLKGLRRRILEKEPQPGLKVNAMRLKSALEDVYREISKQTLKETLTKTDWVSLKEDYIEIRDSIKEVIRDLNHIQGALVELPTDAASGISDDARRDKFIRALLKDLLKENNLPDADSIYSLIKLNLARLGLTPEDLVILQSIRYTRPSSADSLNNLVVKLTRRWMSESSSDLFAEILEMISAIQEKKMTLDEVYTIANRRLIEKLEEDVHGVAFAKKAAEEFAIPKVDALELTLSAPGKCYFVMPGKDKRWIIADFAAHAYEEGRTCYTGIQAFDARLESFEMQFDPVRLTARIGDKTGSAEMGINNVRLKYYYYVDELKDKYERKMRPVVDETFRKRLESGSMQASSAIRNEVTEPDELPNGYYYLTVANDDRLAVTRDVRKSLYFENLFQTKPIAPNYETARLVSGQYTFSKGTPLRMQAYGPASWMYATIEPLKTLGSASKLTTEDSRNAAQIRLNFEGTLYSRRIPRETPFQTEYSCFRYTKVGFVLNWKGNLDRIDSLQGASAQEKLIDLYSENSESMLYFSIPIISVSSPTRANLWDFFVVRPMIYHERFKVNSPGQPDAVANKLTGGFQVRVIDLQNYGGINFRWLLGWDYRNSSYVIRSSRVGTTNIRNNISDLGDLASYAWFTEFQPYNLNDVFGKIGFSERIVPGKKDKYYTLFYVSLNYRINPLDVIIVTKKILLPGS